nr:MULTISPECIES: hypothetical protein [Pseudomonas]
MLEPACFFYTVMGLHEASRRLNLHIRKLSDRSEYIDYSNLFTSGKTIYCDYVYKKWMHGHLPNSGLIGGCEEGGFKAGEQGSTQG